mgnify:CR=1 FL=1
MEKIKNIFNQKTRNILSIIIIILGVAFLINYIFYTPSYINTYIATNIYKEPANKYFDDDNFYKCVVDAYNRENKKSIPYTQNLSDSQLGSIKKVDCDGSKVSDDNKVKSAKGIEKLTALTSLDVYWNKLTTLDVSKNTALTSLEVSWNKLTTLDVSNNTKLTSLKVRHNQLTTIDVSNNTKLTYLDVEDNKLTTLDVSNNTVLTELEVSGNQLTTIDVSKNTALTSLWVDYNKLTTIDVSNNTVLTDLSADGNQLTTLDVSKNTKLTRLDVEDNNLTTLDVSNNTALTELDVEWNQLTTLDVSKNTELTYLNVNYNRLTTLDVSNNTALTGLYAGDNQLTTLDVSNNTKLTYLDVEDNKLTTLDVSNNTVLTELEVSGNQLTTLDVSNNTALTSLWVEWNQLTTLDVSNNTALTWLDVKYNRLTTLDVSNNTALTSLWVDYNKLSTIYTKLNDTFSINNGLILPDGWKIEVSNDNKEALSFDGNNGKGLKVGHYVILFEIYNSQGKVLGNYNFTIYVYNVISDMYGIDKDNIYIGNEDSNEVILNNIKIDGGNVGGYTKDIDNNKLIIKHNNEVIKEYNLVKLEVSSNEYFVEDKEIKYIGEFDVNKINLNYGSKEVKDNKLIIKYNDKIIKEYNLVKLEVSSNEYFVEDKEIKYVGEFDVNKINLNYGSKEVKDNKLVIKYNNDVVKEYNLVKLEIKSKHYSINVDNIVYVNDFDINEINLNYGSKEVKDNKLVIKYNDKVIKEYKLYDIKTKYSVINNTIYVGKIINTEDELRECIKNCSSATDQVGCADDCEMRYNILDHITSSDLKLSIDKDKLICKYNNEIINEFVLSYKNEYDIIDDYTKKNDIISRIPIDTDMNVFKTKINTNIGYIFKDSKNNDIVTNRKLRTGDKVIFNYSSGDIDYVLSVIGDVNGDGIINGKDIMEISNDIVGNKKLDNLGSLSGDIDNNGKMDIRDIIKMGNYIKKGKF